MYDFNITGDNLEAVVSSAEKLAKQFWDDRKKFKFVAPTTTLEESLEQAIKSENKPLILLEIAKAHLGLNENDKANECLTKLLGIWEDADEEYIYYQEAKKLWKELNLEKVAVA